MLVAALEPPTKRMVLLAKFSETILINGREHQIDTNFYHQNVVYPCGYKLLKSFELAPFPTMHYAVGGGDLIKQIIMPHLHNSIIVSYMFNGSVEALIQVRIFPNARDHHHITRYDSSWLTDALVTKSRQRIQIRLRHYAPTITISFTDGRFIEHRDWYYNFRYPIETERGLEDTEDLPTIGYIEAKLKPNERLYIVVSVDGLSADDAECAIKRELERRMKLLNTLPSEMLKRACDELLEALGTFETDGLSASELDGLANVLLPRLWLSSDAFVTKRPSSIHSIIAGYPWFTDWGRDAMLSLPGLTLITGRYRVARNVLKLFGEHMEYGIIPNFFPDGDGKPTYNTVDASLWFAHASYSYLRYTRDFSFVRSFLYDRLRQLVNWYVSGTNFGIRMLEDGLIYWRAHDMALTWMDAKVDGMPVTPRYGKPVEVNALWLHCLWFVSRLARTLNDTPTANYLELLHRRTVDSFHEQFWDERSGYLCDVVDGGEADTTLRPNQLVALMLPSIQFDEHRAHSILKAISRHLLTPMGLRTLPQDETRYVGRYIGDQRWRDAAYHNGTVWAWLLGPMCTAYARYNGRSIGARLVIAKWMCGMLRHLGEAGVGYISEIADGDPPHTPRGCIAQAWSIAEVLRSLVEDVFNMRKPKLWDEHD